MMRMRRKMMGRCFVEVKLKLSITKQIDTE